MRLFDWFTGKPSIDQFAESIMAGLRTAGDTRSFRYDREGVQLLCEDCTMNLREIYTEHCQLSKAGRQEHLQHVLKALLLGPPLPEDFEDAAHDLRPHILPRLMFAKSARRLRLT